VDGDGDGHEHRQQWDREPEEGEPAAEVELGERDADGHPLGKAVDREHSEDEHELREVRLLVLPGVDVGVREDVVGHDDEQDAGRGPEPDLEERPVGQPLPDQPEQRRRHHDARGEPPQDHVPPVAHLLDQKEGGARRAPSPAR
jgi:hypothetical protein